MLALIGLYAFTGFVLISVIVKFFHLDIDEDTSFQTVVVFLFFIAIWPVFALYGIFYLPWKALEWYVEKLQS